MSPVVMEPPPIQNMHSPALGNMTRLQQFNTAPLNANTQVDHIRQNDHPHPLSPSPNTQQTNMSSEFFIDPQLNDKSPSEPSLDSNQLNKLSPSRQPCQNCHTLDTPLWRRDADGNPVCNACGEFIFFISTTSFLSIALHVFYYGCLFMCACCSGVNHNHITSNACVPCV